MVVPHITYKGLNISGTQEVLYVQSQSTKGRKCKVSYEPFPFITMLSNMHLGIVQRNKTS